jgi:glycosyltransferase involved in cell wall biosynthesis
LVAQKEFHSPEVELVISDNASTDHTAAVAQKYAEYKNIHYHRNEKNNLARNFVTVMSAAHGLYRKLSNDYLIYNAGSIEYLLRVVKENMDEKPVLLFFNGNADIDKQQKRIINDFNEFVRVTNYFISWMGVFGIWDNELGAVVNMYDSSVYREFIEKYDEIKDALLRQEWDKAIIPPTLKPALRNCYEHSAVILQLYAKKSVGVIDNKFLVGSVHVERTYNYASNYWQVFFIDMMNLFHPLVEQRLLSDETFAYVKRKLLFGHILSYTTNCYVGGLTGVGPINPDEMMRYIKQAYGNEKYYYLFRFKLPISIFLRKHKQMIKPIIEIPVKLLCCLIPVRRYRKQIRSHLFAIVDKVKKFISY